PGYIPEEYRRVHGGAPRGEHSRDDQLRACRPRPYSRARRRLAALGRCPADRGRPLKGHLAWRERPSRGGDCRRLLTLNLVSVSSSYELNKEMKNTGACAMSPFPAKASVRVLNDSAWSSGGPWWRQRHPLVHECDRRRRAPRFGGGRMR